MPLEGKQLQIQYKLADMKELQFALFADEWPPEQVQLANQLQYTADTAERIVRCTARIEYKLGKETQLLLMWQSTFEFSRDSWSSLYNLEGDEWIVPVALLRHFADLTIGAMRGALVVHAGEKGFPAPLLPNMAIARVVKNNIRFPRLQ